MCVFELELILKCINIVHKYSTIDLFDLLKWGLC